MKHSEMTDAICDSNLLKRKTRGQIGLGGRAEERVEDLPCGCLGSGANPRSVLEARVWESSFSVALEVMEVEVTVHLKMHRVRRAQGVTSIPMVIKGRGLLERGKIVKAVIQKLGNGSGVVTRSDRSDPKGVLGSGHF